MIQRRKRAFTLVELLVVIGIIALLISVLLPALNSARSAARTVQCESNFKQIYNAVLFYSNQNGGLLPYQSSAEGWQNTHEVLTTNASTYLELSGYLGVTNVDPMNVEAEISPVFRCVEAGTADEGAVVWAPKLIRTVLFHPRAFPGYDQKASAATAAEYPQRKLVSIRKSSEKIAFFEAPQAVNWNMTAVPAPIALDGWRWSWGYRYLEDMPDDAPWDAGHLDQPIDGANADGINWMDDANPPTVVRFRHSKNTRGVIAFFDGHVESRKFKEIKAREFAINK